MENERSESVGTTRLAYILGVELAEDVERQWPQMGEVVRTARLVERVEDGLPELTLEVGRRLRLGEIVLVEWNCDYGDGRIYRNVTIAELRGGKAARVTDYWGEPTETAAWRGPLTARLEMAPDGIWPDDAHLKHL
jgi:hypothetical protein